MPFRKYQHPIYHFGANVLQSIPSIPYFIKGRILKTPMPPVKKRKHTSSLSVTTQKSQHAAGKRKASARKYATPKTKQKWNGSRELTVYKRKPNRQVVQARVGSTESHANLSYKPGKAMKYLKLLSQPATWESIDQFQAISDPTLNNNNKQLITVPTTFFTGTDFTTISANLFVTGQTTNAVAPSTFDQSFKLGIDGFACTFEFVNMVQTQAEIDIYEVISKITKPAYVSPATDWQTGMTAQEGPGVYTISSALRSCPTESKAFNMTWKIIKKTTIELAPGELHKHTFVFKPKRQLDTEYYYTYNQIKGITGAIMMVFRGTPVDAVRGLSLGSVQQSPIKISGWYKRTYKTRELALLPRNNVFINNISGAVQANAYTINEEAGTSTDVIGIANSIA